MCFDGEHAEVYSQVTRKARKVHRCECCASQIKPGDLYIFGSGIFEGEPYSLKVCGVCDLLRWLIHVHELADGCRWGESWCESDEIGEAAQDRGIAPPTKREGQRFLAWRELMRETRKRLTTNHTNQHE